MQQLSTWLRGEEAQRLRRLVEVSGKIEPPKNPWELFRFKFNDMLGIVYSSGKVVYHEPLASVIEDVLIEEEGIEVGSDEAGKGERTGPIVVAAVALDSEARKHLRARGLLESKSISRSKLMELASLVIERSEAYEVKVVFPEELSSRWRRGNLNELLVEWYYEVIAHVLGKVKASRVVIDSFDERRLRERFSSLKDIEVVIEPKADEKYASVAAASVLAKEIYLKNERKGTKWI
ncbi:MAG: hypothetical protein J7L91_03015 [Candidatus Korarchaeota archaeon]|nr:hypothetical protein [Candidatus Korarchaeota archaeon]